MVASAEIPCLPSDSHLDGVNAGCQCAWVIPLVWDAGRPSEWLELAWEIGR